jgi:hypothetical protein
LSFNLTFICVFFFAVDVKAADPPIPAPPPTVGLAAALGGSGRLQPNIFNFLMLIIKCLPFSIFYSFLSM